MPRARRRWAGALAHLLVVGLTLACGALTGGAPTAPPTPAPPTRAATLTAPPTAAAATATAAPPPTAAPTATPLPGELTLEQPLTFGAGPLIYTDTLAGLASLASYTARLTLTFAGTRAGQPEAWSQTYRMLATNDPPARQWTIETTGDPSQPGVVVLTEVQGTAYERRGEAACTAAARPAGEALTDRLELAAFLTGVIGADEAGAETLNGVAAVRYTFDQRALGEDGLTVASGALWVAADGHYLVQYQLTREGAAEYFGAELEGTLTLDYALTDLNQPVTIQPAADCPPGLVPAPQLPDAADVVNVPGLLAYTTAASLAEATAFYQAQLPGLGWAPAGEPALDTAQAVLNYTQADQRLTVRLQAEAGQTTVTLVLERLPI